MLKQLFLTALFLLFASSAFAQAVSCVPTWTPGCVLTFTFVDNSNNELGFNVKRRLNSATYPTTPQIVLAPNVTTFTDSGMVQSTVPNVYTWEVTSFNKDSMGVTQESAPTNEVTFTVPAAVVIPPPLGPSNLSSK